MGLGEQLGVLRSTCGPGSSSPPSQVVPVWSPISSGLRSPSTNTHRFPPPAPPATTRQLVALSLIYLGGLLLLRSFGLWFGDNIVWPIGLFTFGGAIMWDRTDQEGRARFSQLTRVEDSNRVRLVVGALLMFGGMAALLGSTAAFSDLGPALFAVLLTAGGFMVAFGPWVWRMMNDLGEERRSRIRTESVPRWPPTSTTRCSRPWP